MRDYDRNEPVKAMSEEVETSYLSSGEKEYVRPRMDYLRDYEISIKFLSLGCVVRVGCKEIAFTSIEEAMKEINAYVTNPKELEIKYNKLFNEQK
jgi:hypothetical protein